MPDSTGQFPRLRRGGLSLRAGTGRIITHVAVIARRAANPPLSLARSQDRPAPSRIMRGFPVRSWAQVTQALADYRQGRFAEAVAAADSCLARGPVRWNLELPARLVRAMALSRLGRPVEARAALDRASELYQTCVARPDGAGTGGNWPDLVIGEILLREAEALILDSAFPTDPFAH